jgi:hypothetical protein
MFERFKPHKSMLKTHKRLKLTDLKISANPKDRYKIQTKPTHMCRHHSQSTENQEQRENV